MICGLSTGWKWSERSLCSAGLVRRIWLSRVMSGASELGSRRSQWRISYFSLCRYSSLPGRRGTFSPSSKAGP